MYMKQISKKLLKEAFRRGYLAGKRKLRESYQGGALESFEDDIYEYLSEISERKSIYRLPSIIETDTELFALNVTDHYEPKILRRKVVSRLVASTVQQFMEDQGVDNADIQNKIIDAILDKIYEASVSDDENSYQTGTTYDDLDDYSRRDDYDPEDNYNDDRDNWE